MEEQTPIPRQQGWRLPVALLSIGWALTFATFTACAAAINLAGASFSSPGYHTFPLAAVAFSTGLHNLLLPREIEVLGRWRAYLLGALLGGSGCLLCFAACEAASMALLCCGAVLVGVGIAHGQNYRFGVLLCVPDAANHPVAISWVLAGGVIGAVVGPEYAKHSRDLPPLRPYSGVFIVSAVAYAMLFALLLLGVGPLQGLRSGSAAAADPHRRRLVAVFAQPRCAACTFVATASFSVMTFLMAAVPLAMSSSGFTFDDSSTVIQGHSAPLTPPGPWPAFCSHPCRRIAARSARHVRALVRDRPPRQALRGTGSPAARRGAPGGGRRLHAGLPRPPGRVRRLTDVRAPGARTVDHQDDRIKVARAGAQIHPATRTLAHPPTHAFGPRIGTAPSASAGTSASWPPPPACSD